MASKISHLWRQVLAIMQLRYMQAYGGEGGGVGNDWNINSKIIIVLCIYLHAFYASWPEMVKSCTTRRLWPQVGPYLPPADPSQVTAAKHPPYPGYGPHASTPSRVTAYPIVIISGPKDKPSSLCQFLCQLVNGGSNTRPKKSEALGAYTVHCTVQKRLSVDRWEKFHFIKESWSFYRKVKW